jgi:hypothetical protein
MQTLGIEINNCARPISNQQGLNMQELRIHGVGAPSHSRLLGVSTEAEVATEQPRSTAKRAAVIIRRKQDVDDGVRGFAWSGLTSGSASKALWVLRLPLSLVNVAGWAVAGRFRNAQRGLIHVLAGVTTCVYVFWFAYLWLDIISLQWRRRVLAVNPGLATPIRSWWPFLAVLVFFGVLAMWVVSSLKSSKAPTKKAEQTATTKDSKKAPDGEWEELVSNESFFGRSKLRQRTGYGHAAVVAVASICAALMFVDGRAKPFTALAGVVLGLGIVQGTLCIGLLIALGVTSLVGQIRRDDNDKVGLRSITFPAATIGAATSHAGFSGLGLLMVDRLQQWPNTGPVKREFWIGSSIADPKNYAFAVGVAILAALAIFVGVSIRHPEENAAVARRGLWVAWAFAGGCTFAALRYVAPSLRTVRDARGTWVPSAGLWSRAALHFAGWRDTKIAAVVQPIFRVSTDHSKSALYRISALMMMAIPVAIYKVIKGSAKKGGRTHPISVVWDLLTFWPRRFHPLGVPSYGQIAVPALADEIKAMTKDDASVLISAHSQGTVLAAAALPLCDSSRGRVHLVTYGSPLGGLYRTAFPAQYPSLVNIPGLASWRNFYRDTDPIGGPIADSTAVDAPALDDPVIGDPPPELAPVRVPQEWSRSAADGVAGHSWYLTDPIVKAYVDEKKRAG